MSRKVSSNNILFQKGSIAEMVEFEEGNACGFPIAILFAEDGEYCVSINSRRVIVTRNKVIGGYDNDCD